MMRVCDVEGKLQEVCVEQITRKGAFFTVLVIWANRTKCHSLGSFSTHCSGGQKVQDQVATSRQGEGTFLTHSLQLLSIVEWVSELSVIYFLRSLILVWPSDYNKVPEPGWHISGNNIFFFSARGCKTQDEDIKNWLSGKDSV